MPDIWSFERANGTSVPNMASWHATNSQSDGYLIQASWPLGWPNSSDTQGISKPANVIYTTDGNAMFLSATEAVRRRQSTSIGQIATIVIAISYLLTDSVYSPRRNFDLTPPAKNYTAPPFAANSSTPSYGGADILLDFITKDVNSFMFSSVFPHVTVNQSALFGHSYGGLFALHTLYTAPASFDAYLAASPSVWWNNRYLIQEEKRFTQAPAPRKLPDVWLSYGTLEQHPVRQRGETKDAFEKRVKEAEYLRMGDNVEELYSRLGRSNHTKSIKKKVFQDEDHGSVVAGALSGAIYHFLNL